jgi:hypothetical protein
MKNDSDFEKVERAEESVEVKRQNDPGREEPSYHVKQSEKERSDSSSWSGASAGGGVWAGRSRHDEGRSR